VCVCVCVDSTSFTDRNSEDPSGFSDEVTSANLFVRDREISEKRLLKDDCGTLQSALRNHDSATMWLHLYQHKSININMIRKPLVIFYHC